MLPIFLVSGCSSTPHKIADRLLEKWPFEIDQAIAKIDDRVIDKVDENGLSAYYWKTDEYLKSPKTENLRKENFSQIMRIINAEYQLALEKLLQENSFELYSPKDTANFLKLHNMGEYKDLPIVHLWKLNGNIYLLIYHSGGSSGERSYIFYFKHIEKWASFDYPPNAEQIKELAAHVRAMEK
jgi:hypothetical protein